MKHPFDLIKIMSNFGRVSISQSSDGIYFATFTLFKKRNSPTLAQGDDLTKAVCKLYELFNDLNEQS